MIVFRPRFRVLACLLATASLVWPQDETPVPPPAFSFPEGACIAIVGNTFAERLGRFGHFEAALQGCHRGRKLRVRNLGWSADAVDEQPRPLGFGSQDDHLRAVRADVVLLCFGMNESYQGEEGLAAFEKGLGDLVSRTAGQKYNGRSAPRVVLVSPIAHEQQEPPRPGPAFVAAHNRSLALYTEAMRRVAERERAAFLDLFAPSAAHAAAPGAPKLTINGIHLSEEGDRAAAGWMLAGLGLPAALVDADFERVRALVREKDRRWFFRHRPVNGEYVFGRRKEPFGVRSFPPEMERLDAIVAALDEAIWSAAAP